MTDWNFADIYEAIAAAIPDAPCQVNGDRVTTWEEFDRRANAFAADLIDAGLTHQSKMAAYLYNGVEYLETYVGAFKGGFAPVNTNYRYGPEEIVYLFDNADAEAVVFHASFTSLLDRIRGRLTKVRRWYVVSDDTGDGPDWAVSYESVVAKGADRTIGPWGRSGKDLLLLYTGGTTGMPKGVMWEQDELFNVLGAGGQPLLGLAPISSAAEAGERLRASVSAGAPLPVTMSACPLMHGTGQFSSLITMNLGGSVVTLPDRKFDAGELWRTCQDRHVNSLIIVGDAFARPMVQALDANPGKWDLSSLALISSSGVMWSHEVKERLLEHIPNVMLFDSFGSSEAVGMGASLSTKGAASETAAFMLGERVAVFTEDGRRVEPGSDERGMVAVSGFLPAGYYKDQAKTDATFREFEGKRWSIPGDWAQVNPDGTLHLLGRGSVCINTGGEKVFPEEVEEVLKLHPAVRDAVCVGIPDERFGETICAVVEASASPSDVNADDVIAHVKGSLAAYKAPRNVVVVETIGRSPAGKVDYKGLKALAAERLGK
jgi:3-oxocholest-4-en-26-oate---CoA ligase